MQKQKFVYRKMTFIIVWMLIFGAPFIWLVPDMLSRIEGAAYYIVNGLIMIAVAFVLWKMMDALPGIRRNGYYWEENGKTVIEYDRKKVVLDSVTEIFLTDKHASSQGINLLIRNNDRKIEFLSEALDKDVQIEETTFFAIFSQILAENPQLHQNKDIWNEPIDYWYIEK